MAEAGDLDSEKEAVVTLEENQLPGAIRFLNTARGSERREDESDAFLQPLLQLKHQDSRDETDVADPETSGPHELELEGGDQRGRSGSVRSLCSDSGRTECHICNEWFDSHTLLKCNHTLCQRCVDGIMSRAKEPGRMRCPFCRQTSPLPQWEIRRLQEEFYSSCASEAIPALVNRPGPEPQAPQVVDASHLDRDLRRMRPTSRCLFIIVFVLLCPGLLGCFLYLALTYIFQFLFSSSASLFN